MGSRLRIAHFEPLDEEIDQDTHLCRQVASVGIDREYAAAARHSVGKHSNQPAGRYIGRGDEIGKHDKSKA